MTQDPYRYFRVEAHDLLEDLQRGALELERGGLASEVTPRILRAAHTLKSAARVVRQREMGDMAHAVEDALVPFRELAAPVPRGTIDAVVVLVRGIAERLATIDPSAPSPARPAPEDPFRVVRADIADVDGIVEGLSNVHVELGAVRHALADAERAHRIAELLTAQLASRAGGTGESSDRTKARALADDLSAAVVGLERRLTGSVERAERELLEVRESAERLRLVPAAVLLDALERTARDAAGALGRRVDFHPKGGDVRLDAHVLTLAQGALVQIVRNAVAHGIEPETDRRASGKPAEGRVSVTVERRGNRITFTCKDDGRGVDLDAVRAAARRKGALRERAELLAASELLELLLQGGLSTATSVTAIAGRGVGMDIVRDAAARLGGRVRVRSDRGHGTEVRLSVPALLSALDVLLVEVGGQVVGIPIDTVRGTRRVVRADRTRGTDGETIVVDGRAFAFASLAQCMGLPSRRAPRAAESAVLVEVDDVHAALGVDRLAGLSHVLVRPLPDLVPDVPIVSGVALDAVGNPIVVLDTASVLLRVRAAGAPVVTEPRSRPVLVVDDSLTTRMLEQSILESAGYEVDLAVSAEDALVKMAARSYALALVDVEMPGMDGFELIAHMRGDPRLREIPAILVTSRSSAADRARGDAVGANGHMVKGDFDQGLLLTRIAELVA